MTTSKQTYGLESAKPPVCSAAVVSTEVDGEFVVVNTETNEAHALEGDVATVWRAVQAGTKPDLPGERSDEIVDALVERGLLIVEEGYSRRSVLKAGAAAFAVAGITSIALPAGALAAASHTFTGSGSITLNAGQTTNFTLIGGGGGGGGSDGMAAGGSGGAGGIVAGTIKNTGATNATLTIDIGGGGEGGSAKLNATGGSGWIGPNNSAATGVSGGGTDGSGQGGGGGGGASAIVAPGPTLLIIAGGGGGGSANNGTTVGPSGTGGSVTGASTTGGTGAMGSAGAGGGGGGGTPGTAGNDMTTQSTGGTSFPTANTTIGSFMITINGSTLGSAGAAGTAGGSSGGNGGGGEAFFEGGVQ